MWNKTKIVATVGPASRSATELKALVQAGVDVFRINGAYENVESHAKTIALMRKVAHQQKRHVAILLDLPGPKFRLGKLTQTTMKLKAGQEVTLACGASVQRGDRIPIPVSNLQRSLKPGNTVFINDGIVELKVLKVTGREVHCRVKAGGEIRSGKGLNLPRVPLKVPSLTTRDRKLAKLAVREGLDYVGLSFVRSAGNVKALRRILRSNSRHIGIVAKIEKPEALDELDEIIKVSDAVMVARGDLGIEMPFDQIPLIQRHILRKCLAAGKPTITATQMLESMVKSSRPTRAEATDVAQAVWEGTDAVMLSEETSVGINPAKAVRAMAHIALEAEREMPHFDPMEVAKEKHEHQAMAISRAACFLAEELGARAIITPTRSGRTPLYVSRSKPDMMVIAPTEHERTARRMSLYWGVLPIVTPVSPTVDTMLKEAARVARRLRYIKKGDTVVITSGAHGTSDDITRLVEVLQVS